MRIALNHRTHDFVLAPWHQSGGGVRTCAAWSATVHGASHSVHVAPPSAATTTWVTRNPGPLDVVAEVTAEVVVGVVMDSIVLVVVIIAVDVIDVIISVDFIVVVLVIVVAIVVVSAAAVAVVQSSGRYYT